MARGTASHHEERTFSLSVALICGIVIWHLARCGAWPAAIGWATVSAAVLLIGRLRPQWLVLPSAVWWRLLRALGWINGRMLLTLLFFGLVTPVGWIMRRIFGWDPLTLAWKRRATGGWADYPASRRDPHHYQQMF